MLATMVGILAAASIAGGLYFDSHVAFRHSTIGDLARAYSQRTGPTVLAVGSSRTAEGIEINRLTAFLRDSVPEKNLQAFAATITGSGPVTQELLLRSMLAVGPKPEVVLLEVSPEFLDARKRWISVSRDMTWGNLLELRDEGLQKFGVRLLENRLLPFYARRFQIRREAWRWACTFVGVDPPKLDSQEPDVPAEIHGFIPNVPERPTLTTELQEVQKLLAATPLDGFRPTGSAARAVERMLMLCADAGIPVLLVEAPVCTKSRDALAGMAADYRRHIQSLLSKHPNARYFDAAALIPDEGFRDQHHANAFGQNLLCRRLAAEALPNVLASSADRTPDRLAGRKDAIAR